MLNHFIYFFKGLYAISAIQKYETNKRYIIAIIVFKTFRKICFSPRQNGQVQGVLVKAKNSSKS
jgi:hypothetical protein